MVNKDLNASLDAHFEKNHQQKNVSLVEKHKEKKGLLKIIKEYFFPESKFEETVIRNDSLTVVKKNESPFISHVKLLIAKIKKLFEKKKRQEVDVDVAKVNKILKNKS